MSDVYLDNYRLYAYLNGVRTDITADAVTDPIRGGGWGMSENKAGARVGGTGWLKFTLLDPTRKYIPDSATALSGWDYGTPVELECSYDGSTRLFRFYVKDIEPPGKAAQQKVNVTALDWMDHAAEFPITNPGVLTDQRGDDVLRTALELGIKQPQNTAFAVGEEVFPTTFDTVTSQTKFYDEAVKAALSELGWVYLRKDRVYGETLVFDNASSRSGTSTLSPVPLSAVESGFLLKEDDGFILKEDGGKIILNQVTDAVFDNSMIDFEAPYGKNLLNHLRIWANPRRKDTSAQILFKLDQAFVIGSGQTYPLRGTYADPAGGLPINANPDDMITPVITTDYLFNTASDGSGSNISSDLELVSIEFGSEGFTAYLLNNNAAPGWVTKFNTRGLGIYNYNPIQHLAQDSDSRDQFGTTSDTLDQKYKVDLAAGSAYAHGVVEEERIPKTTLKKFTILANRSDFLMQAFLGLDVGYLAQIMIDDINLNGYYFIQGVEEFSISPGGKVLCTWFVKEFLSLLNGLSMIAVEFSGVSSAREAINFGYLPLVSSNANSIQRSFSAWIYLPPGYRGAALIAPFADAIGTQFSLFTPNPSISLYAYLLDTAPGQWKTPNNSVPTSQWVHVAATYDASAAANDPILYIDAVSQALTELLTPSGSFRGEVGSSLVIGNRKSASFDYPDNPLFLMQDVRIYNRILLASEITSLYNSGTPDYFNVTDGLVFQAFAVKTKYLTSYIDETLTGLTVRDNMRGAVGTVVAEIGGPIGRTP